MNAFAVSPGIVEEGVMQDKTVTDANMGVPNEDGSDNQPIVVANVEFTQPVVMYETENEMKIGFNLFNFRGSQPDIRYGFQLIKNNAPTQILVDELIYDEVISLNENASKYIEASYKFPEYLPVGEYDLFLVSKNESGFPFGSVFVKKLDLKNKPTAGVTIIPESCFLKIKGDSEKFNLIQGVDIYPNEGLSISCEIVNNSEAPVSIKPDFKFYTMSTFGKIAESEVVNENQINLDIKEKKLFSFIVPKAKKSNAYQVKYSLTDLDGKVFSNELIFRYVLSGESAAIRNIILDKASYKKDETLNISVDWSGSAGAFPGARHGNEQRQLLESKFFGDIEIKNGSGYSCIDKIDNILLVPGQRDGITRLNAVVKNDCVDPHILLALKNEKGDILDTKELFIDSGIEKNKISLSSALLMIVILIFLVILLVYLKKRNKVILVLFLLFFLADYKTSSAVTYRACPYGTWSSYQCSAGMDYTVSFSPTTWKDYNIRALFYEKDMSLKYYLLSDTIKEYTLAVWYPNMFVNKTSTGYLDRITFLPGYSASTVFTLTSAFKEVRAFPELAPEGYVLFSPYLHGKYYVTDTIGSINLPVFGSYSNVSVTISGQYYILCGNATGVSSVFLLSTVGMSSNTLIVDKRVNSFNETVVFKSPNFSESELPISQIIDLEMSAGVSGDYGTEGGSASGVIPYAIDRVCVPTSGQSCTSLANACGVINTGTIGCNGTCSATIPANPIGYGTSCISPANSCGKTSAGIIGCTGTCTAVVPANPIGYGTSCVSPANSCGMTSTGILGCEQTCAVDPITRRVVCTPICTAVTPPESLCPSCVPTYNTPCISPANACGRVNSGITNCDGTCSAVAPADPVGYNTQCSLSSACGTTYGLIGCSGCTAPLPPSVPVGLGLSCTSPANACGVTGTGTIQCTGCSAVTPSLPIGYGTYCISPANSCGMTNNGTIGCAGTCSAIAPSETLCSLDIGLRINIGTPSAPIIRKVMVQPVGTTPMSPLRIAKNGVIYGIALDPASKFKFSSGGVVYGIKLEP